MNSIFFFTLIGSCFSNNPLFFQRPCFFSNMPAISIIVPVYNTQQYLSTCLDSILCQVFTDWELILVDDGSTDGSSIICDNYSMKDSRIIVVHKDNGGVSEARNVGISNARGKWITFVDSDDIIEQDYLSIDTNTDAELQLQNWRMFGRSEPSKEHLNQGYISAYEMNDFCKEHLHMDLFRMVCCKFYLLALFKENEIHFDKNIRIGEDTIFMMQYMKFVRSVNIVGSGEYLYRRQEGWGSKYDIPVSSGLYFMRSFVRCYKRLPYKCDKLLSFIYDWYPCVVPSLNNRKNRLYWNTSYSNLYIQRHLCATRGKRFCIRYLVRLLSSPIHIFLHV